ncbi:MAG: 50S ribosomal protein L18 [Candidatus Liptonbacteria bacterium CG11_big_fil_rev_8_21_14_0_20_35_14]|uniref:Large ribosomal subunit protein uL18 n=1 Tax=Candidatus Liptonbacteria bacterium CG11_big_fil_rev_8_21_14_0_20_35_14 TaxID=1974634 RepID=A0A2H0N868_9BACT|nr:MAG: 50S ribosomal protein L18 [Candidatus Liptonbacteria bacterium CG11_big_fil_rev_8_21_14_0_20_35_14]
MKLRKIKNEQQARRAQRTRNKVKSFNLPRLSVFRSLQAINVQIIDDSTQKTLVSAYSKEVDQKKTKTEQAVLVGELIAKKANENKINKVVFDRGHYRFHGRIKALVEAARQGGLNI